MWFCEQEEISEVMLRNGRVVKPGDRVRLTTVKEHMDRLRPIIKEQISSEVECKQFEAREERLAKMYYKLRHDWLGAGPYTITRIMRGFNGRVMLFFQPKAENFSAEQGDYHWHFY